MDFGDYSASLLICYSLSITTFQVYINLIEITILEILLLLP